MSPPSTVMQPMRVVGIVASAGGLDALLELLPRLQPNGRTTWVVAQHMGSSNQGDLMARLLARSSALPVVMAQADQVLHPDVVYMIPPARDGVVAHGALRLVPPAPHTISTPSGNALLNSMADSMMGDATAVILSGAGRDGVEGARAIRLAGGLVLVQDPDSIKFNGMTSAAVAAGVADQVLSLAELAAALNEGPKAPSTLQVGPGAAVHGVKPPDASSSDWTCLLSMVREATGVDFSGYKDETLLRRLNRRMEALRMPSLHVYVNHCAAHPDELNLLHQHLLVSFSMFFRDRPAFELLWQVLHDVLRHKAADECIRIWVPACASGEEVYSIAIVLAEILGGEEALKRVSLQGIDLNSGAIDVARKGCYRPTAVRELDADLLQKYFTKRGHQYEVKPAVRSCCQFEVRDVFDKAPNAPYDLISCRNLLIYLRPQWQERLLRHLRAALVPDGLLFVSPVESVGVDGTRGFLPVDRDHRLYRKREPGQSAVPLE